MMVTQAVIPGYSPNPVRCLSCKQFWNRELPIRAGRFAERRREESGVPAERDGGVEEGPMITALRIAVMASGAPLHGKVRPSIAYRPVRTLGRHKSGGTFMVSVRSLTLSIFLIGVCTPGSASSQVKAPARPAKPSAGIHVDRHSPDDGAIVTRYQDLRSGRILIVKGTSEPALAKQWMTSFNDMKDVKEDPFASQMSRMVTANLPKGLLGLTAYSEGVRLTVYSGELPGGRDAISVDAYDDPRSGGSGRSVTCDGSASQADATAWLEAANKAATESDLAALLTANHSKGLTGVSGFFNGMKVETRWQRN